MTKPRTQRNAEPLPPHVHHSHSANVQQQRAGSDSAARQRVDAVWAEVVANTDAKLARPRARVRWE